MDIPGSHDWSARVSKVGIVTFSYGDNFGQRLQNLAMQEIMIDRGHEAFSFHQIEPKHSPFYHLLNLFNLLRNGSRQKRELLKKRHLAFMRFDKMFIQYAPEPISPDSPPNNISSYTSFIAGSDQIWSPYSPDVNETMFLSFAPREKRVAVSPSLACNDIPVNKIALYRRRITGFDHLSVRESQSAQLIKQLYGLNAEVLLDPTLMFDRDFWERYELKPNFELPSDYILTYYLGDSNYNREIETYCSAHGCTRIDMLDSDSYIVSGPREFIYLIHHAKAVATDSYHGTIFSLLFNKDYQFCPRRSTGADMGSRFTTLAEKLGIELTYGSKFDPKPLMNETTSLRLMFERNKMNDYLTTAGL